MPLHNMKFILMNLLDEGAISATDFDGFSEELRGCVAHLYRIQRPQKKVRGYCHLLMCSSREKECKVKNKSAGL